MIPIVEPCIGEKEIKLVTDALERQWISPQGEYVREFEENFADFVETEYAFATSTGTAALHLSLVAAGVQEGDEVIVPAFTWIACANTVRYIGAEPVFADVKEDTYNLDPESVRNQITPDTAAIMPVHIYGQPCEMDPLLNLAQENDLFVLEDAAEAHGATYQGNKIGSLGNVGCFSFYGNKILTTGQGGMITTNDEEIADKIELYRRDGMSRKQKYYHPVIGYNYRLTNIQAAIGVAQVERASELLSAKKRINERYRRELDGESVHFQAQPDWGESAHWMTAPIFETANIRNQVKERLNEKDIETRPFFYPLHQQPPYEDNQQSLPIAESISKRGLNIPSGPKLKEKEIIAVVEAIQEVI